MGFIDLRMTAHANDLYSGKVSKFSSPSYFFIRMAPLEIIGTPDSSSVVGTLVYAASMFKLYCLLTLHSGKRFRSSLICQENSKFDCN